MADLLELYKERTKTETVFAPQKNKKKMIVCDASKDHINDFHDKKEEVHEDIILSRSGVYEKAGKLHKLHVPKDIAEHCADDHIVSGCSTKDESRFGKSDSNKPDTPTTHPAKKHGLLTPAEDHIEMGKSEPEVIKLHHKPIPSDIQEHVVKSHVAFGTENLPAEGESLLQGNGKKKTCKTNP